LDEEIDLEEGNCGFGREVEGERQYGGIHMKRDKDNERD
jgi:hypothetical protein